MSKAETYFRTTNDPRGPQINKEMESTNMAVDAARQIRDAVEKMCENDPSLLSFTVRVEVSVIGQFKDERFAPADAAKEEAE